MTTETKVTIEQVMGGIIEKLKVVEPEYCYDQNGLHFCRQEAGHDTPHECYACKPAHTWE